MGHSPPFPARSRTIRCPGRGFPGPPDRCRLQTPRSQTRQSGGSGKLLIHHHIVRLLNAPDILDAVLKGFRVAVIERSPLCAGLQISEALALPGKKLRLVLDGESLALHFQVVLSAEFPVMSDPTHFEPLVPAGHVPLDYIAVVEHIVVAEIQPSVIRPSEQGNLILIGLGCRRCRGNQQCGMIMSTPR